VWVSRDTVERGSPQRLEISRLPSLLSWPSKHRSTSNARDTTWMTSPSPASPASAPCLLNRSERRPMRNFPRKLERLAQVQIPLWQQQLQRRRRLSRLPRHSAITSASSSSV
ncbi:hypothetical protein KXW36_001706, partial [Aspergillus fumigatus]